MAMYPAFAEVMVNKRVKPFLRC